MSTLYLTLGAQGGIWNGRPNINDGAPQLYKEFPLSYQLGTVESTATWNSITHNNIDIEGHVTTSTNLFISVVAGVGNDSAGKGIVMASIRNENEISTWTHQYTAMNPINGICYGDGNWVGVGPNNSVITSTDTHDWVERTGAVPNATWTWVIAAPEPGIPHAKWRFVAVGYTKIPDPRGVGYGVIESGVIQYSDDGGVTWGKGANGANAKLQSIAYSPELNIYVAVGNVSTNPDGSESATILSVNGR